MRESRAGAISIHTLTAAPHVSVVFLRIPDGFDGSGSAAYGWQSLSKLWDGWIFDRHDRRRP